MSAKPSINNLNLEAFERIAQGKRTLRSKKAPSVQQDIIGLPNEQDVPKPSRSSTTRVSSSEVAIRKRAEEAMARTQAEIEGRVIQAMLPMWDDINRGVPNEFVRSGLFTVKNSEKREYLSNLLVASLSNYELRYQGEELQQDDLTVWMSLINMARSKPMSEALFFTGYQLIKDIGWRMHSESYKRAQQSIQRLKVTALTTKTKGSEQGYSGSLIRDYGWSEQDEKGDTKWMVRFEPRIAILFLKDNTTLLEWETRKKIGPRATLALWFHSFYSSHNQPYAISLEKFWELCRSGSSLSTFRKNVRNALGKLVDVGFLKTFTMIDDIIKVEKVDRVKILPFNPEAAKKISKKK